MTSFTLQEKAVLRAIAEMYDEDGEVTQEEIKYACAGSQETLAIFHQLENSKIIQFTSDGRLDTMPPDDQFIISC